MLEDLHALILTSWCVFRMVTML